MTLDPATLLPAVIRLEIAHVQVGPAHRLQQPRVVVDRSQRIRVRMTGRPGEGGEDGHGAAHQRRRVGQPVGVLDQLGDVVELKLPPGMRAPSWQNSTTPFSDGESATAALGRTLGA